MALAAALRRPVAAAALQPCSSGSSGASSGGGGSGHPFAAAVLAAVQTIAALQLVVAAPVYADGGDFRISSQAAGPEAAEEEQYFETVSWQHFAKSGGLRRADRFFQILRYLESKRTPA